MNGFQEKLSGIRKVARKLPVQAYFDWLKGQSRIKKLLLVALVALPAMYLLLISVVLPVGNIGKIPGYEPPATAADSSATVYKLSQEEKEWWLGYLSAQREIAIKKHRLALAGKDSIYLRLQLADSTLHLEIKGIPAYSGKMLDLELGAPFESITPQLRAEWAAAPFVMQRRNATIEVFPVVYKEAPKDTAEANALPSEPMAPEKTAVFFDLQFDRGLRLLVEQDEEPEPGDRRIVNAYMRREQRAQSASFLRAARRIKPFLPEMTVKFRLPAEEARALYRALPEQTHLLLQY
jgi:hypothetical protein